MNLAVMRQVVKNDPETKDLKINDFDIIKVYQYIQERDDKSRKDGYEPVLVTNPYIEIIYRPTKEKDKELRMRKIKDKIRFFETDVFIQDASLSSFVISSEERQKAFDLARDFLDNYKKDRYHKGLYIYGKYNSGKSYLLSAIAKELAEREYIVLFVYMPDLVRSIKNGINEGNLEERINQLKQADILILDDIGGENMSVWFRDEILAPVIQYRLSASLPVFMSSNLEYLQLVDALAITKDEMAKVKATRLIRRFDDLMTYVKLTETYKG